MEIKLNSKELCCRLKTAERVINKKSPLSSLRNFLLEYNGDSTLVVTASDGEQWLSQRICATGTETQKFSICVNADYYLKCISNLNDCLIRLVVDEKTSTITCDYDNGKFLMHYEKSDDFPSPDYGGVDSKSAVIYGKKIMKAIELTSFAVGNSQITPVMNGIHFEFSENGMTASATNRNKVAIYKDVDIKCDFDVEFIIPKKSSSVLSSLLSSVEGDVNISFGNSEVFVSNSDFNFSSRLIEGRFFNCKALLAVSRPMVVTVDKLSMLQALRRVMPASDDISNLIVMSFEKGKVTVSADDVTFGKSAVETVVCDCDSDLRIGFKCSDLIEMFENIDDENVVMEMINQNGGAVFYASSSMSRNEYASAIASSLIIQ